MQLEKEIHQKQFRNEQQKSIVNILFTYNWLISRIKNFLKPYDITPQQFNVLRILKGQHPQPISTSAIRERMLDKMSDVSRIVDRLLEKQLIVRTPCPTDRRLVDVFISEQGLQLLSVIDMHIHQLDALLHNLSPDESRLLNELLDKIRD
ncbi:MarR family transcriptional regulator [Sphingobacteriales bacterium UPWRP_1]|nr:MarR family transcriptional regulator [Sphingobacteriales bacterium TSM_CSM]PSJ73683.1 MarR family transcriptional regulator [Sphingobacteriales bacterium UPWRP_1]